MNNNISSDNIELMVKELELFEEPMLLVSLNGLIEFANSKFLSIFKFESNEIKTLNYDKLMPVGLIERHHKYFNSFFAQPNSRRMNLGRDVIVVSKFGDEIRCRISLIGVSVSHKDYAWLTFNIADQFIRTDNNFKRPLYGTHDSMTHGVNRHYLMGILKALASDNSVDLTFVYIDLDNLKFINDSFGHNVGDEVIIYFSEICRRVIRGNDIFARLGGDEFLLVFSSLSVKQSQDIILRIKTEFTRINDKVGIAHYLDFSFGIVRKKCFKYDLFEHIIKKVDGKMYADKKAKETVIKTSQ